MGGSGESATNVNGGDGAPISNGVIVQNPGLGGKSGTNGGGGGNGGTGSDENGTPGGPGASAKAEPGGW